MFDRGLLELVEGLGLEGASGPRRDDPSRRLFDRLGQVRHGPPECGSVRVLVHTALLLLALAQPTEVLEEWTLLDTAPLREALTARAVYRRDEGPEIALPAAFDGDGDAPQAALVGAVAPLPVWRQGGRWHARLPSTQGPRSARVVIRSVRVLRSARLFQLRWPMARGEASRRVAIAPRGWLTAVTEGWTCADDSIATIACVSIDTAPNALALRVPAAAAVGWHRALALVALVTLVAASVAGPKNSRWARLVALSGALLLCACVALTWVGARLISWALAMALATFVALGCGWLSMRSERAKAASGVALATITLLAVFDGRPALATAALVVASAVTAWLGRAPKVSREA